MRGSRPTAPHALKVWWWWWWWCAARYGWLSVAGGLAVLGAALLFRRWQ